MGYLHMSKFSRTAKASLWVLALCLAQQCALAQDYPSKPVKIMVSSSAGSAPDLQVRLFTRHLARLHGYAWVVENVPGAGGNIASERVARSVADGYTLLFASAGPLYFNPSLYATLTYDIQRDFEPITQLGITTNILAVHPSLPIRSVSDLVAYARANPGRLRFGSPGSGTSQHLSGELFKSLAGVDMQHVPYSSSSQMTTDLMTGQIELSFQNAPSILPPVRAGKLRALAVTSKIRLAAAGNIPTMEEAGVAGYDVSPSGGLLAPRGTPRHILNKLERDLRGVIALAEVREQYETNGWIPVDSGSAEFAARIKSEIARWAPVIRATGAKVD